MSVEFDTPANRIIQQFEPKNKFRIDTSLPELAFLRQLSIQGRLRYERGSGQTPITITPNVGDTIFIYRIELTNAEASNTCVFTITNDGITRVAFTLAALGVIGQPYTLDLLDSLVGDGTKQFKITTNRDGAQVAIQFWLENTSRIRDVAT